MAGDILYPGANKYKKIRAVEKQIGWDIVHYEDCSYDYFKVPVQDGYTRGRVILP